MNKKAAAVVRFIENKCKVPEGERVGKPLVLAPFQKKFVADICRPGVRRGLLSIARKNGKTVFIAALMLAHVCGPLVKRNAQIISGAMSRDQAALVFDAACKMIMLEDALSARCHIVPSSKIIQGIFSGVRYRAISKDAGTAQGLSPVFTIIDEIGQIRGSRDPFVDAILTSQGAHEEALLVAISTQAPSDADLFSVWIDDALRSNDKSIVCHLYAAKPDCDLLDKRQWKRANPGLGSIRSEKDLRQLLEQAQRMPSAEASARNLLLNQRVSLTSLWISPNIWKENAGAVDDELLINANCHIGLDLSARNDLTAAVVAIKSKQGEIHLWPLVFTPADTLAPRELQDRAPYSQWVDNGQLVAVPGRTIDYEYVADYMRIWTEERRLTVDSIEFDRWRIDVFKKASWSMGFGRESRWHAVGQGYKDFSPRCEAFMSLLLNKKIRHGGHPLLAMAASNAISVQDPAGSIKLDKSRSTQRIDPVVAAVIAAYPLTEGQASITSDGTDIGWWIG